MVFERRGTVFEWTVKFSKALEYFKEALISEPILKLPCWEKKFVIKTNASATGVGAALIQLYDEGLMHASYASRTMKVHDSRYLKTNQEGFAVVWTVNHFKLYVMGTPFLIVTNHVALTSLKPKKNQEEKMLRYAK